MIRTDFEKPRNDENADGDGFDDGRTGLARVRDCLVGRVADAVRNILRRILEGTPDGPGANTNASEQVDDEHRQVGADEGELPSEGSDQAGNIAIITSQSKIHCDKRYVSTYPKMDRSARTM